jgi:hypothetical protein
MNLISRMLSNLHNLSITSGLIRKTIGKSVVLVTESSKLKELKAGARRTSFECRVQEASFSFGAYDLLVPCAEARNLQSTRKDLLKRIPFANQDTSVSGACLSC